MAVGRTQVMESRGRLYLSTACTVCLTHNINLVFGFNRRSRAQGQLMLQHTTRTRWRTTLTVCLNVSITCKWITALSLARHGPVWNDSMFKWTLTDGPISSQMLCMCVSGTCATLPLKCSASKTKKIKNPNCMDRLLIHRDQEPSRPIWNWEIIKNKHIPFIWTNNNIWSCFKPQCGEKDKKPYSGRGEKQSRENARVLH